MTRPIALASVAVAIGTLFGTGSTLAADLPRMPTKIPTAYQAPPSWTGCYVGANAGYGWDSIHDTGTAFAGVAFAPPIDYGGNNGSSIIGGGQIGCDYQFASAWVIGIQGKADFGKISTSNPVLAFPGVTAAYQLKNTEDLTARLGYAFGPTVLGYVKGGVAWANTNVSALVPPVTAESTNILRTGYTVGGGVEWKIVRGWSVFAEYNYMDFGTATNNLYATGRVPAFGAAGALSDTVAWRLRTQQALLGVNYRLDWGSSPIVTKY